MFNFTVYDHLFCLEQSHPRPTHSSSLHVLHSVETRVTSPLQKHGASWLRGPSCRPILSLAGRSGHGRGQPAPVEKAEGHERRQELVRRLAARRVERDVAAPAALARIREQRVPVGRTSEAGLVADDVEGVACAGEGDIEAAQVLDEAEAAAATAHARADDGVGRQSV